MIQLQLETIAVCNARCVFCPYPDMKRKRGLMPVELFYKIVRDSVDIPQITELSFQGLGEPLLDSRIVERVRFAREMKPRAALTLYTNGSRLTPGIATALENAGLTTLYVSVNASDAQRRKDVMGLDDYEAVVRNVKESMRVCSHMNIVPKAVVGMGMFSGAEVERFKAEWGKDGFLHLEGNWAGGTYDVRTPQREACGRALGQIMVLWDGRVSLCCFDGEGEVIFGDLTQQTIRDVYNSEEYVGYRLAHSEGRRNELKLCNNCTAI